jgi:hypothetical protein
MKITEHVARARHACVWKLVILANILFALPLRNLELLNVFHVPQATKKLIVVHQLFLDNDFFLEFRLWFFLIKGQEMRNIPLEGKCYRGLLYPLPSFSLSKIALRVNQPSLTRWHGRLSHPAYWIIELYTKSSSL